MTRSLLRSPPLFFSPSLPLPPSLSLSPSSFLVARQAALDVLLVDLVMFEALPPGLVLEGQGGEDEYDRRERGVGVFVCA